MSKDTLILTCIDRSSVSEHVCDYASWIAKETQRPVRLLHAIEQSPVPPLSDLTGAIGLGSQEDLLNQLTVTEQNHSKLLVEKGQLMLNASRARMRSAGVTDIEDELRHGALVESLIEMEEDIRVLVMGVRGEDHEAKKGIGTKLETVIRSLHKPILVVNEAFKTPEKILLAYDGSQACRKALHMVASSQLFQHVECHIVHVGNEGDQHLAEASAFLRDADIKNVAIQLQGKEHEVLAAYQVEQGMDMMVMGAFSHNRFRDFLLGSFTAKMLAKTQKPVLLLR